MWAPSNAGDLVIFDGVGNKWWNCKDILDFWKSSGNELSSGAILWAESRGFGVIRKRENLPQLLCGPSPDKKNLIPQGEKIRKEIFHSLGD